MITTKAELNRILAYEKEQYMNYMFPNRWRKIMGYIKREPIMSIWRWQKAARISDFHHGMMERYGSVWHKLAYLYWIRRKNTIGEKLGIEFQTEDVSRGLFIYHYGGGIVANGRWGENCHLHGNNCIGNAGAGHTTAPTLGNNVIVGVGAKIIGDVTIADDVKIAAGAVVVKDVLEPGCTVAGIPAVVIKHSI